MPAPRFPGNELYCSTPWGVRLSENINFLIPHKTNKNNISRRIIRLPQQSAAAEQRLMSSGGYREAAKDAVHYMPEGHA